MPRTGGTEIARWRARLANRRGQDYWRSLEELADAPDFRAFLEGEFPRLAGAWQAPVDRRQMLRLMATSLALAGLGACEERQPQEEIVPYVNMPEGLVPGRSRYYATALAVAGYGEGVLVESREGRPIKVEGNPRHPASLGATDAVAQAALWDLYDSDRSQAPTQDGRITDWGRLLAVLSRRLERHAERRGRGLAIMTAAVRSPSAAAQLARLFRRFPEARWCRHEPVAREWPRAGAELAFDEKVETIYHLDRARRVLSLDGDFLGGMPGRLRYARDWSMSRRPGGPAQEMSRLYAVESMPTITGAMAEHRRRLPAHLMPAIARALAKRLGLAVEAEEPPLPAAWIEAVAQDLASQRGAAVVVPGEFQAPEVHALAHAMNHVLDATGSTVSHLAPTEAEPQQPAGLVDLVPAMQRGEVESLLILDCNPVYDAPADVPFAAALNRVPFRLHWGLYADETAQACTWHVPAQHALESWSDLTAFDGTASIVQPLIRPLYEGRSLHELLAVLQGAFYREGHQIVREHWRAERGAADFARWWRETLQTGVIPSSGAARRQPRLADGLAERTAASQAPAAESLRLQFRPDPMLWDGRFANNGWLQELPRPLTLTVWGNAALIAPDTAERLGIEHEETVTLSLEGRELSLPAWLLPGHAEDSVTLHLGYGRWRAGRLGSGVGANAYRLRRAQAPWLAHGLGIAPTSGKGGIVSTQHHHSMEGRHLARETTADALAAKPEHDASKSAPPTFYSDYDYSQGYAWGMVIDTGVCIGCNICTIACQAENNTPVVGAEEVARGREMHWLRVDRYYKGPPSEPETRFLPVPCQHCERAPCEYVCPVEATLHDSEGLNVMVYNRCIGTRYCSQNCPYKVRRFNWLDYNHQESDDLLRRAPAGTHTPNALQNPEVTVRSRGVMEKCTYCLQRISAARIRAKREGRRIREGEVVTACQAACPTEAIHFGDLNAPRSKLAERKRHPLNYDLLGELNTRPRTSYWARVLNRNPRLAHEG